MDRINYNQSGGFPLNTDRLTDMQESLMPLINGLGAMAGNLVIISGCEENNTIVSNGIVQIEGEIFEFKGGPQQEFVTLFEEKIEKEFETGEVKAIYYKRTMGFGSGAKNYKWADFKRVPPLNSIETIINNALEVERKRINKLEKKCAILTKGIRMLWEDSLDKAPDGWKVVDAFAGKIPIGFDKNDKDFNVLGATPGGKTTKIEIPHLPPHSFPGVPGSPIKSDGRARYLSGYSNDGRTPVIGEGKPLPIVPPVKVVYVLEYLGE